MPAALAVTILLSCFNPPITWTVHHGVPPSPHERYCAWFGDARDGVLYFGESAFWSTSRAQGTAVATLAREGPARVGRFDLATEQLLQPLDVSEPADRAGVWDVLAHRNGRVYFTTFFGSAGWVMGNGAASRRLPALGKGLNEWSPGPHGTLLVTRYFRDGLRSGGDGGVVQIDQDGGLIAEHTLPSPAGWVSAAKTPAWDPIREQIWVTADVLPEGRSGEIRRGAYLLDAEGRKLEYIERPEIQFVAYAENGTGYRAEVDRGELWLRVVPPDANGPTLDLGYRVLLDPHFPAKLDFAQEIRPQPDGGAVVTRWSGRVHVVDALGRGGSLRLPELEKGGLYYTAVLSNGRICTTYCADVAVVCDNAP